jgi:hypothetical protein
MKPLADNHPGDDLGSPRATARLDFHRSPSIHTVLDGAWWPRSHDTVTELTELIVGLAANRTPVTLIMLNPEAWQGHPRRIEVAGATVRVAWFADLDPALLIATTHRYQRFDLLVAIEANPADATLAALTSAPDDDAGADELATVTLLAALARDGSMISPPPSEADWESEGGRIASRT